MNSRSFHEAIAGGSSLKSVSVTLPSIPSIANPPAVLPMRVRRATLRFSLPEPFHEQNRRPPCEASEGPWLLVSEKIRLPPKPTPSGEKATLSSSLPEPFQPRNSRPLCEQSAGAASLVSASVTLPSIPSTPAPPAVFAKTVTLATLSASSRPVQAR